ncbi:MAG: recombinase family protein [Terracidiphilus sp.]|jgi:DNA invertase Pin-like site-specific DNA recombinase
MTTENSYMPPAGAKRSAIYARSATGEADSTSVLHQIERCKKAAQENGWSVVEDCIRADAGKSGTSMQLLSGLKELMALTANKPRPFDVLVCDSTDRLARNWTIAGAILDALTRNGVSLHCVQTGYESNIDVTAAGMQVVNLFGGFNQFFSDSYSKKQRYMKRLAVAAGRVPWHAPIGYRNINAKEGPNIEHDERYAPHVRRSFQLMETGLHKKYEVLEIVTLEGFRTLKGKPLSNQTFDHLLRNPIYAGWITLPSDPAFRLCVACTNLLSLRKRLTECRRFSPAGSHYQRSGASQIRFFRCDASCDAPYVIRL